MKHWLTAALICFGAPAHAEYISLPANTPEAVNKNFKDIEYELAALNPWVDISTSSLFVIVGNSTVAVSSPITGDGSSGSPIDIDESLITLAQSQVTNLTTDLSNLTTSVSGKVAKAGDTMTGQLNVSSHVAVTYGLSAGSATFTASATMPSGSTLTLNSGSFWNVGIGVTTGQMVWVASATAEAVSTYTFTLSNYLRPQEVAASSISWRTDYRCYISSDGTFGFVILNGDTSQSYDFVSGDLDNGGDWDADGNSTSYGFSLNGAGQQRAASGLSGSIWLATRYSKTSITDMYAIGFGNVNGGTSHGPLITAGQYANGVITSISFVNGTAVAATTPPDHAPPLHCHYDLYRSGYQW